MLKNKKVLILIILLTVAIVGGGLLYTRQNDSPVANKNVNYGPATKADKKRAEATKERIESSQQNNGQNTDPTTPSVKTVKPIITYAGQYDGQVEVGAYVSGILESNSTCTATMAKDGKTVTKQVSAVQNVSSMDCPVMIFQNSELPSGNWSVTVTYNSATSTGVSETKAVTVK